MQEKNKKRILKNSAFSVVELIVVISIFAIMTSVLMFNYNDHISRVKVTELTEDVALTIRQAQVYGTSSSARKIASEAFADSGNEDSFFDIDIGAYDITQDKSVRGVSIQKENKRIFLFEDNNRNYKYDSSDIVIDERIIAYKKIDFIYYKFCKEGSCSIVEEGGIVDIVFKRPYPDSIISFRSSDSGGSSFFEEVYLVIGNEDYEKTIKVNSIGNIVVH